MDESKTVDANNISSSSKYNEESKTESKSNDNIKEQKVRDKIDHALAQSVKSRERKPQPLETGFVPFAEKGRKITKASLIVRLEQELEDVERQLAGISEIRTDNFYKERDRSRTPSASSRGSSRSSGLYRKNKRPGTAPRSRSANNRLKRIDHSDSDSKKKRPQSASASTTRMRQQSQRQKSGGRKSNTTTTTTNNKASSNRNNARPESNYNNDNNNARSRRPQTAGRGRTSAPSSATSSRNTYTSSNNNNNRNKRPQSSPLVRHGAVGRKPRKLRSIAGYTAPDLIYDEGLLAKARQLNAKDLTKMGDSNLFRQACLKSGCTFKAVFPKPVSSFMNVKIGFQRMRLNGEEAHERWAAFEDRRLKLLATVLTERQNIIEEMKKKQWETDPSNPKAKPSGNNLTGLASKALVEEDRRSKQVKRNQMRNHQLLLNENKALEQRRIDYEKRLKQRAKREKDLMEKKHKHELRKMEVSRKKEAALQLARKQREEKDRERLLKGEATQRRKFERAERIRLAKANANKEKEKIERERKRHRDQVKKDREKAMLQKEKMIRIRLLQKDKHIEKQNKLKRREWHEKKKEALFKSQTKKENLERIKQQQNYHRVKLREQLKQADLKRERMNELNVAVIEERRKERKIALINKHSLKRGTPVERNIMPGPGAYSIPTTIGGDGKGFKIGDENPMGYIEIVVNRAKQIPGPNAYGFADYPKKMKAVKFSDANVPSDVEWIMRRSREVPAADAYQNGNAFKSDTPAFSMGNFKPKSDIDWIMARSASTPGPSDYYEGLPKPRSPLRKVAKKLGVDVEATDD